MTAANDPSSSRGEEPTPAGPDPYPADHEPLEQTPTTGLSAAAWIGIAAAVLVLAAIIALHVTGAIGPGAH